METQFRTDQTRAESFVQRWQTLDQASEHRSRGGSYAGIDNAREDMTQMAKSLERDPQLESLLANRKAALGIQMETGLRLGRDLAFTHGLDIGRGRGLGV